MADTLFMLPQSTGPARAAEAATQKQGPRDLAAAEEAAQAFESVFLAKMLEGMSTGLSGSVMSGGQAEDTWRSFMNDEYAKLVSRSGGVGVADAVLKAMLDAQEVG
ncbi:MAG TPA: rod-binding protein [Geminicoccus sp.]|jgi:Rod binding domain-containing protein|uniref:rod-binding protein n=1 Tax=Geminicoccus sp. TaxID=2024832 RepID=UPI002E2F49B8|nr:rod-binding protein [Geminicoccus sp.]HEX2525847.1 rod-binding protein [Geminicoccus sp.]